MEWESVGRESSHGRGCSAKLDGVRLRLDNKHVEGPPGMRITISESVMKQLRWKTGDRIAVDMNFQSSAIRIRRVTEVKPKTWKLTGTDKKRPQGIIATATVRPTITDKARKAIFPGQVTLHETTWEERDGDLWLLFEA